MLAPRMRYLLSIFAILTASLPKLSAALPPEVPDAVAWYDSLNYPNTAELPYVRVASDSGSMTGTNPPKQNLAEGFLLNEDAESFTVFICGVADFEKPWWHPVTYPALTTRRFDRKSKEAHGRSLGYEILDLKAVAEDVLARVRAAAP